MKKVLAILLICLSLSSCMALKYGSWAIGAKSVTEVKGYRDKMNELEKYFPEIYNLYNKGKVNVSKVYIYVGKDGRERTHIEYNYL